MGLAYEIVINSDPCISYVHGRKHHGHADTGHGARRFRAQPFLQVQSPVQAVTDRRSRHSGLPGIRPALHCRMRGTSRRHRSGSVARCGSRAHAARRLPLPAARVSRRCARSRKRQKDRRPARGTNRQLPVEHLAGFAAVSKGGRGSARTQARAAPAGGKSPVFPRTLQSGPAALATRSAAYHPQHRPVFLSAEADQADERGLCDLRAFSHRQCTAQDEADHRRPRCWKSSTVTPMSSSSRISTIRASAASTPMRLASR